MGNNNSSDNCITLTPAEYLEKQKHFKTLEIAVSTQQLRIAELTKETEELRYKLQKIKSEKSSIEVNRTLEKVELEKYRSLPVLDAILKTNSHIKEVKLGVLEFSNVQQSTSHGRLETDIRKSKENINKYKQNIRNNDIFDLPEMEMQRLQQLEYDVNTDHQNLEKRTKKKISELLTKLEQLEEIMPNVVEKKLATVKTEVLNCKTELQSMQDTLTVDAKYSEIKAILVKQENILLNHMMSNMSVQGGNEDNAFERFPRNNSNEFSVMFRNVPERSVDNRNDYEKVKEILAVIPGVTDFDVKLIRFGRYTPDKTRIIKVTFSSKESGSSVLRNKHNLRDTAYSAIKIHPFKEEGPISS